MAQRRVAISAALPLVKLTCDCLIDVIIGPLFRSLSYICIILCNHSVFHYTKTVCDLHPWCQLVVASL